MNPEKQFQKAVQLHQDGRHAKAKQILSALAKSHPGVPVVPHLLGFVELALGNPARAVEALTRVQAQFADDANLWTALGAAYGELGRDDEAIAAHGRACQLAPQDADRAYNLANALSNVGRLAEAVELYRTAAALAPDDAESQRCAARDLLRLGKIAEAADAYVEAIRRAPDDVETRLEYANMLTRRNHFTDAAAAIADTLAIAPDNLQAQMAAANFDVIFGRAQQGVARMREIVGRMDAEQQRGWIHLYVQSLNYDPMSSGAELRRAAEAAARTLNPPKTAPPPAPAVVGDRPLKIGILSSKLARHPVGHFLNPFVGSIDRKVAEIHLFAWNVTVDPLSETLARKAAGWHDLTALDRDDRVAAIRAQGIDVLITPSGVEEAHLLADFRRRPAPLQLAGFAAFSTTGLPEMDGFLSDRWETPPDGDADDDFTERLIRLPDGYICYALPDDLPRPAWRQGAEADAPVTFGCFNNLAKICDASLAAWAAILQRVPGSRLLLKCQALDSPRAREVMAERTAAAGIAAETLLLEGPSPHAELLAAYDRVDVALDPFAYSGGVTTLEAIAMGVPVITLPGNTFARRHSLSHLMNCGLGEFVATEATDYVERAVGLATHLATLAETRPRVRAALAASPLTDGARYGRNFAAAIRSLLD